MADDEKELKDQRVVTMMSPSELETVDNWMFKNRIRSRGEAIRRLCQMGILADEAPFMNRALALLAQNRKNGGGGKLDEFLSGKTVDEDIQRLCWTAIKLQSTITGFRNEAISEAMKAIEVMDAHEVSEGNKHLGDNK